MIIFTSALQNTAETNTTDQEEREKTLLSQWAKGKTTHRKDLNDHKRKKIKGIQPHWKCKLKISRRYNFIVQRLAKSKQPDNIKGQQRREVKGTPV